MRLSEAIREGAKLAPQGFGSPTGRVGPERTLCALEAAAAGIGLGRADYATVVAAHWEWTTTTLMYCSCSWPGTAMGMTGGPRTAISMVMHLNDAHSLSREEIADLVAAIEPEGQLEQETYEGMLRAAKEAKHVKSPVTA